MSELSELSKLCKRDPTGEHGHFINPQESQECKKLNHEIDKLLTSLEKIKQPEFNESLKIIIDALPSLGDLYILRKIGLIKFDDIELTIKSQKDYIQQQLTELTKLGTKAFESPDPKKTIVCAALGSDEMMQKLQHNLNTHQHHLTMSNSAVQYILEYATKNNKVVDDDAKLKLLGLKSTFKATMQTLITPIQKRYDTMFNEFCKIEEKGKIEEKEKTEITGGKSKKFRRAFFQKSVRRNRRITKPKTRRIRRPKKFRFARK